VGKLAIEGKYATATQLAQFLKFFHQHFSAFMNPTTVQLKVSDSSPQTPTMFPTAEIYKEHCVIPLFKMDLYSLTECAPFCRASWPPSAYEARG
jgi:hypothetical protein